MFEAPMKRINKTQRLLSLGASLLLLSGHALAETPNSLIHVTSEQMVININNHTATYISQVKADQGQRTLAADKLVIDQGKSSSVQQMTAYGNPAVSTYTPENTQRKKSIGKAKQIIYIPDQNLVRYQNDASLEQDGNIFKGQIINYNTQTEIANSPSTPLHPTVITIPPYDNHKNTSPTSTKPR